jgi:hypothetical protein
MAAGETCTSKGLPQVPKRGAQGYRPRRPAETVLYRVGARHVHAFLVDVLRCPRYGGRRRILTAITEGRVVRAILEALGLPTEPPTVHPARGPPEELSWERQRTGERDRGASAGDVAGVATRVGRSRGRKSARGGGVGGPWGLEQGVGWERGGREGAPRPFDARERGGMGGN